MCEREFLHLSIVKIGVEILGEIPFAYSNGIMKFITLPCILL
jgi:hypothetical protein